MLKKITVEKYSLINDCHLELACGLNVFTGETGSGKTVFLKNLLSVFALTQGNTACSEDKCFFEVILETSENEDGFAVIRKETTGDKKARYYINGRLSTQETVRSLVEGKLIVHSQNQTVSLLKKSYQQKLFDESSKEIKEILDRYVTLRKELSNLKESIEKAEENNFRILKRITSLEEFIDECEKTGVGSVDEKELKSLREVLKHRALILETVRKLSFLLKEDENSATNKISEAIVSLQRVSSHLKDSDEMINKLESALEMLNEVTISITSLGVDLDSESLNLDEIERQLYEIQRIKKKFGIDLQTDIKEVLENSKEEINALRNNLGEVSNLKKELDEKYKELEALAKELSEKRKLHSNEFSRQVNEILKELNMGEDRFKVNLNTFSLSGEYPLLNLPYGIEEVQFLFKAVKDDYLPVSKIASGGELSRLMLALETFEKDRSDRKCYIFDEVDSGIGGNTGVKLGKYLKKLAGFHQVIVITHLPQVAAFADKHFLIERVEDDENGFKINVFELTTKAQRIEELARMLSGGLAGREAIKHAETLLNEAGEIFIDS